MNKKYIYITIMIIVILSIIGCVDRTAFPPMSPESNQKEIVIKFCIQKGYEYGHITNENLWGKDVQYIRCYRTESIQDKFYSDSFNDYVKNIVIIKE